MNLEKYLIILVLRTLGSSQDEVADLMHCAKQTVVDAERWFVSCPQGEAGAMVDDQRIKRLVGRELPGMALTEAQLVRAGQITGDDILLHYGRARSPEGGTTKAAAESNVVAPIYTGLLNRHWNRLCEQATALQTQLSPPDIAALFAAEVCQKACDTMESGSPLQSDHSCSRLFDMPVELRFAGRSKERAIEVRLPAETEFLYPHLMSHLGAEFGELIQLRGYKELLGQLMLSCLQTAESVSRACCVSSGMYYSGREGEQGLSRHLPAFICQFILNNLDRDVRPRLRTEPQPGGLCKLIAEEWPTICLAVDTPDHISRCQQVLLKQVEDNRQLHAYRKITKYLTELRATASQLQTMLTTVIERGYLRGTCALCQGYFDRAQSA